MLAGVGFVFVAYGGLLNVVSAGEELKDPVKNIPRGMVLSLTSVGIFYDLRDLVLRKHSVNHVRRVIISTLIFTIICRSAVLSKP